MDVLSELSYGDAHFCLVQGFGDEHQAESGDIFEVWESWEYLGYISGTLDLSFCGKQTLPRSFDFGTSVPSSFFSS